MRLHITAHIPSAKIPVAGQKVSYNWFLNSDNSETILICITNKSEKKYLPLELENEFKEVHYVFINRWSKVFNTIFYGFIYPTKCSGRHSKATKKIIRKIILKYKIKRAYLEFTSVFSYYRFIKKHISKVELIAHDISFQSWERRLNYRHGVIKAFYRIESMRLRHLELELFKSANVNVLSFKDKNLLISHEIPEMNIKIQLPILDSWIKSVSRNNFINGNILFVGALKRPENVDGLVWFIENVFRFLKDDWNLIAVGNVSKEIKEKYETNKICFKGFVEDLRSEFEKAEIAISPILYGAGVKIKTLEYLAAGIPTISTNVGAEGVDKNELLTIADSKDDFTRAIDSFR